ncbi:MAG: hypothetical protein WBO10_12905 [Pyrinomonadaceae bacterium]
MKDENSSFLETTNPDDLSPDDREKHIDYWFTKTPGERLKEVMRLNIAKWGEEVFERGMDKTRLEVVDRVTGKVTVLSSIQSNQGNQ